MLCEKIKEIMSNADACKMTTEGAQIVTHCLYPSYDSVRVFAAKFGDTYIVHDGGGARREAWLHARDDVFIGRSLSAMADRYHLEILNGSLVAKDISEDWIHSAILSVANASSLAAADALVRSATAHVDDLPERINEVLVRTVGPGHVARDFTTKGSSGGNRHFDFAVRIRDEFDIFINAISPHKGAIYSRYVSFADTAGAVDHKYGIFDAQLDTSDVALLSQVSLVTPFAALQENAGAFFARSQ
jgi:hypothetical protein